jgi:hypothetical protein
MSAYTDQGATFSADGLHRYRCWRTWSAEPPLAWLMLNPSTADASALDPTLRRCEAFSRREGAGGFEVWNLWSLRATDPAGLWRWIEAGQPEEVFAANADAILAEAGRFPRVVCAWGAFSKCPARLLPRAEAVARAAADKIATYTTPVRLGEPTKTGQPRHPLYVDGATPLVVHRSTP